MYVVPLITLIILAIFSPWIDFHLSSWIYEYHGGFYNNALTEALFTYGTWPSWIAAFISLALLFSHKYRRPSLLFILVFSIGSGLIINGLLKELWPRPRPVQILDFGGSVPFHAFWSPLFNGNDYKSFPSGHAAAGFIFFAWYYAGKAFNMRALKIAGLILGCGLGIALSVLRIVMGGHFFFDTLFSAALMWYLPPALLKIRLLWKS